MCRRPGRAVSRRKATLRRFLGSAITLRSNRTSTGHKAFFETALHGNRGAAIWELEDQGYLKFYSHTRPAGSGVAEVPDRERGWTHIHLSNPGAGGHANTDTVPGLLNGYLQYFRWQYVHFGLQLLGQPDPAYAVPTFADACQVQAVPTALLDVVTAASSLGPDLARRHGHRVRFEAS